MNNIYNLQDNCHILLPQLFHPQEHYYYPNNLLLPIYILLKENIRNLHFAEIHHLMGMGSMTLLPTIRVPDMGLHYMAADQGRLRKDFRHELAMDLNTYDIAPHPRM